VPTDKKFTGRRLDATGLYYYGARYYDATIGRFTSADTIVQSYIYPQSLNRYSYTMNNPLKYIDPSGNIVEIGGLDVRFTRGAALNAAFLPPDIADSVVNVVESPEYQAYNEFKHLSQEAELMAISMELNTEHIVTITSGETPVWWAETTRNGNDFIINLHPDNFLPGNSGQSLHDQALTIYQEVTREILDTTNFSFWDALWDSTIGWLIDKISGMGPLMDAADIIYQIKQGNSWLIALGDNALPYIIPSYEFFKSLFGQTGEYYQYLINNDLLYEFRDE